MANQCHDRPPFSVNAVVSSVAQGGNYYLTIAGPNGCLLRAVVNHMAPTITDPLRSCLEENRSVTRHRKND